MKSWGFGIAAFLFLLSQSLAHAEPQLWQVPASGKPTLMETLQAAQSGDTIEVNGGLHSGSFVIEKSLHLVGKNHATLDGKNSGTVVILNAPDIHISGFHITGTGTSLQSENSGIAAKAPRALIENNQLENVLFGISLSQAHQSVVRQNTIRGKPLTLPLRGDPIRV